MNAHIVPDTRLSEKVAHVATNYFAKNSNTEAEPTPSLMTVVTLSEVLDADLTEGLSAAGYIDDGSGSSGDVVTVSSSDAPWNSCPVGLSQEVWDACGKTEERMMTEQFRMCGKTETERTWNLMHDAAARSQEPNSDFAMIGNARMIALQVAFDMDSDCDGEPYTLAEALADAQRIYGLNEIQVAQIAIAVNALRMVAPVSYRDGSRTAEGGAA